MGKFLFDLASAVESSVVALARTGDARAYTELVRRRQLSIRGLLRRLCRNSALADDLAQDTFLKAWRQLPKLKSDGAFGAWLRQIATNTWLQHIRMRHESMESLGDSDAASDTAQANAFSTSQSIDQSNSEALDLDIALSRLVPVERACIVLSYHEGMSHGEIALALNLPLGTVKTHIARATQYLRTLLAAYRAS